MWLAIGVADQRRREAVPGPDREVPARSAPQHAKLSNNPAFRASVHRATRPMLPDMPRQPRIEIPGGIHHVTARGNRRADIFVDDADRSLLLSIFARALLRFDTEVFAYRLMGNHYHFVLQTRQGNLSALMARVNGQYVQAFNRRHHLAGRLFEGRFKSIHVDKDGYLMVVCRCVELNPVAARMVESARDWRWSSYRANAGFVRPPAWLATHRLHQHLLARDVGTDADRRVAQAAYRSFVDAGHDGRLWQDHLREGNVLGDDAFVARLRGGA